MNAQLKNCIENRDNLGVVIQDKRPYFLNLRRIFESAPRTFGK